MITNRYKQDLLERRRDCLEINSLMLQNLQLEFVMECNEWIKNYDKLIAQANTIPEDKKLFYKVREMLDKTL